MLYQVSDIKDHDKKVEILKADPEYIRRYRNRSFEMIATAIEGDVLLASELLQGMDQDSVFLFAKAIAIGVNQFTKTNRYHTSERLCQTARLLEGYTFSDQEQALLLDEVSDLNDIDDFLVNCTFDAPLAAKVATRFGYQAFEQLVNFPDQLDAAFAEHGVYLLHQYIKKGFLTLSPALLATALEGQPVSATDFKTRDLKEVVEPVLADPDYRRVIIENGFIHLFPEDTDFTEKELLHAASSASFFGKELRKGYDKHGSHHLMHLWSHKLFLHYIQTVPNALEALGSYMIGQIFRFLGLTKAQRVKSYQLACQAFPMNLFEARLDYEEFISVSDYQIQEIIATAPERVWDLPRAWVTEAHLDASIKACSELPSLDDRLTESMIDELLVKPLFPSRERDYADNFGTIIEKLTPKHVSLMATHLPEEVCRLPLNLISEEIRLENLRACHFGLLVNTHFESRLEMLSALDNEVLQSLAAWLRDYDYEYRFFDGATITREVLQRFALLVNFQPRLFGLFKAKLSNADLIVLCQFLDPDVLYGSAA